MVRRFCLFFFHLLPGCAWVFLPQTKATQVRLIGDWKFPKGEKASVNIYELQLLKGSQLQNKGPSVQGWPVLLMLSASSV